MTVPFASVIVPVYDGLAELLLLLDALAAQDYPSDRFEVLVVDNGSTQDVQGAVRARGPPFLALHEATPGSYAARNRGVAGARGEVLAFTDGDCRPVPGWLSAGVSAVQAEPGLGLVGGRIEVVARDAAHPTAAERYEMLYAFPQEHYLSERHFSVTANLFTTRSVLDRVGPFASHLKSGGDRDWGNRVHAAGLRLAYAPDALVLHPARRTYREVASKARRMVGGRVDARRAEPSSLNVAGMLGLGARVAGHTLARLPEARQRAGSWTRGVQVFSVLAYVEAARYAELWRLRRGGASRR